MFCSFFLGFNHDLIIYIDCTVSQLQTQQQMMTSTIGSRIEYSILTILIILCSFYTQ